MNKYRNIADSSIESSRGGSMFTDSPPRTVTVEYDDFTEGCALAEQNNFSAIGNIATNADEIVIGVAV